MSEPQKLFFFSYSRKDSRIVGPVVSLLKAADTTVFFDVETLEPGDEWKTKLESSLSASHAIYVFWCHHSKRSRWVQSEWETAVRKGKKVIPVLLDSTPLPGALADFMWIDFREASTHGAGWRRIVGKILVCGLVLAPIVPVFFFAGDLQKYSLVWFWALMFMASLYCVCATFIIYIVWAEPRAVASYTLSSSEAPAPRPRKGGAAREIERRKAEEAIATALKAHMLIECKGASQPRRSD